MDWLNVRRTLPGDHWSRLHERVARRFIKVRLLIQDVRQFVADLRQLDADTTQYRAPDPVVRRS